MGRLCLHKLIGAVLLHREVKKLILKNCRKIPFRSTNPPEADNIFLITSTARVCVMNKVNAERTETNFQIEKYLQFT